MNFLKTIYLKYDLSVNSEKLSKKPLTRRCFYDIITFGGARCLPHFLFYLPFARFSKELTSTQKNSPRLKIVECQGESLFVISYKSDKIAKHGIHIKLNFSLCERIYQ